MRRFVLPFLSCALVAAAAPPAGAQSAPLEFVGGRPVVSVTIHGKGPYRFVLDTGASGNVIRENVAREAGLEQIGEARVASPANATGDVKTVPVFGIDTAQIGPIAIATTRAAGLPMPDIPGAPRIDGVLSPVSFTGRLLTIDYPKAQLRVEDGSLPPADGRTIFEDAADARLPVLPLDVAGKRIDVHMDSGAQSGITLPIERASELKLKGAPVPTRKGRTIDAEFQMYSATLDGVVKLGNYDLGSDIEFAERAPLGRIGGAILKQFVVTLDIVSRRVRLLPGTAAPGRQGFLPDEAVGGTTRPEATTVVRGQGTISISPLAR